jgi:hypothetical protein
MPTRPAPSAPVRSAVELTARWSDLLDPQVFAARSLWLAWLPPDGLMLPVVVPVDDLPARPDAGLTDSLRTLHEGVSDGARLHLAMALCRPGEPAARYDDVAWAEALRTGVGDRIDGSWSLHLAAAGTVTPMVAPPPWAWS